jgi:hypothetical protein
VLSEVFPSSHRSAKDELTKYKLYFICLLSHKQNCHIDIFRFAACLVLLLDKYDPTSTE